VGQDLGQIKNETEKVVAYVGEGDGAGIQDVEAVCCVVAEAVIWDLTDAIVSRNANVALAVAHRMLEMGESPHRLLAMVNWQMRQLITLQDCMHTGRSTRDAGLKMSGRKMDAARNMLHRRPIDAPRLLADLATANEGFNSSRAGDRRVFEGLLLRLTAGR
jgi:DNA polymerase III delta subunit